MPVGAPAPAPADQQSARVVGAKPVDTPAAQPSPSQGTTGTTVDYMDMGTPLTNRIRQIGGAPKSVEIRQGMGRQVRVSDAIAQVLPAGWKLNRAPGVRLDQMVNWQGGKPWTVVLHGLLAEADLKARVDWQRNAVVVGSGSSPTSMGIPVPTVFADKPVAAAPAPVQAAPAPAAAVPLHQAAAPVQAASPVGAASPAVVRDSSGSLTTTSGTWSLMSDQTLRQNVRRWLAQAGWNLVWSARLGDMTIDYPIDARVDLDGELLGAQGVLAKVILAYKDAEYPLEIEFFRGNKVAEVRLHRVPDGMDTAGRKVNVGTAVTAPPAAPKQADKSPTSDPAQ